MQRLVRVTLFLCYCISFAVALDASARRTSSIHVWPLSASSPSPLVEVSYDPSTSETEVSKIHKPPVLKASNELVRVGLWDPKTKLFHGIITDGATLDEKHSRIVSLHLDEQDNIWHVDLRRSDAGPSKQSRDDIQVELVRATPGPEPILNQPLVLDDQGKIPEPPVEKSFFQKYWWVFLAITMLAMAGSGEK
ncbi:MAG: hypothetical protein M1823_002402 [Watsoniomyces obsoletus]|nr:MAG: hypothetical protein M1823_002402 [Watsoniomyces obsoletus]